MFMRILGSLIFAVIIGGLSSSAAEGSPLLIFVGACFGGLMGGPVFEAWAKAMARARMTLFRIVWRFVLMFTGLLLGAAFLLNMQDQLYLLVIAFVVTLLLRPVSKLVRLYCAHWRQQLTVGRGNRKGFHIIPRRRRR